MLVERISTDCTVDRADYLIELDSHVSRSQVVFLFWNIFCYFKTFIEIQLPLISIPDYMTKKDGGVSEA